MLLGNIPLLQKHTEAHNVVFSVGLNDMKSTVWRMTDPCSKFL